MVFGFLWGFEVFVFFVRGFLLCFGWFVRICGFGCVCGFVRVCNRLAFCAFEDLWGLWFFCVVLVCAIFGLTRLA